MGIRRHCYPEVRQTAEACCHHVMALLEDSLSGRPFATLAVSGGTSPKPLFECMAATRFSWDRVHLFWVDERAVPPTDLESNYGMVEASLIQPAHIPRRNVHRICGELMPDVAARRYSDEIRSFFGLAPGELPHFDTIHRGMGPDTHTASLFPGEPLLDDREGIAAAVYVEKLSQWRITLLPGVLLAAQHTVFFVTGENKAEAVRAVFNEPYDPNRYPAQMASHHGRHVTWFLDSAAARFMDE